MMGRGPANRWTTIQAALGQLVGEVCGPGCRTDRRDGCGAEPKIVTFGTCL